LVASQDPITTRDFVREIPRLVASFDRPGAVRHAPIPATIISPGPAEFPRPDNGDRFGTFRWQSSPSDDVVAEIAEFAYDGDERLFLVRHSSPGAPAAISAGQLWTTKEQWSWRIWSISWTGDIAFSESRTFVH